MDIHIVCLLLIMLIAGAFGGAINHFQTQDGTASGSADKISIKSRGNFFRCFTVGIAAAFMVPLFLNMISSDLLTACRENPTKLLVFAGFCLVASVSSKAFIGTISNRVFDLAKEADEKAERAHSKINRVEKDVSPLIEKETEPVLAKDKSKSKALNAFVPSSLSQDEKQVLIALCDGKYTFRSLNGISSCAALPEERVKDILDNLVSQGLVNESLSDDGLHWCLTRQGRETASGIQEDQMVQGGVQAPARTFSHA